MAKKSPKKTFQRVVTVLLVLCVAQAIFLIINSQETDSLTVREAVDKALDKRKDISADRRDQLRLQMAVQDFQLKNKRLPNSLNELIPTYIDRVPTDPQTEKPFAYRVENGRPIIGSSESSPTAVAKSSGTTVGADGAVQLTREQAETAIASLKVEQEEYIYNAEGKRDPFRPYSVAPLDERSDRTPLERIDLGKLQMKAFLDGFDEPTAVVEDPAGKGFMVKKGAKIGTAGGEVVEILPEKILILERSTDFTGKIIDKTIELKLKGKGDEGSGGYRRIAPKQP